MTAAANIRPNVTLRRGSARGGCHVTLAILLAVEIAAAWGTMARPVPAADPAPAGPAGSDTIDVATRVKIDRHMKAAEAAVAAGQTAAALQELRGANALVKQARGANHPDTLPILDMAADILVANGQFAEAALPLQRAVALRESLLAEGGRVSRAELGASLVLLSRVKTAQGDFGVAATLLDGAITHFTSALEPDAPAIRAARVALAEVRTGLGEHATAEAALLPVVETEVERPGSGGDIERVDRLPFTAAMARAVWLSGRHEEARDRLAAAIARHERDRGPREQLVEALAQLGEMELAAGDAAAAGVHWRRGLEIRRGLLGADHALTAADRLRIVRLDLLAGDTTRAPDVLERASVGLVALAAKGDPLAAPGLRAAAGIWLSLRDPARATDILRHALEADRAALGTEHADAAADEAALGRCLLDAGDAATARRFLEHARAVLTVARGPGHPETLAAVATLGAAAAAAGDRPAANDCLTTLLERQVPWIDERTEEDLRRLADGLGDLADAAGDRDGASTARLALVGLRQTQFGADHRVVVADMVAAAEARQAAGASDDAAALYEQSMAITESTLGPEHPDVAAILVPLARTYRGLGDDEAARTTLERALAIWEQAVGKNHPATLATLRSLALLRLATGDHAGALPLMERLLAAYDADPATDPGDVARLLKRLSAVHESRGDDAKAVALLARAEDIDAKLISTVGGQPAADASRLERLLAVDEDFQPEAAKAKELVLDIDAARERIARATDRRPSGGRTSVEGMAAAAMGSGTNADLVQGLPEAAAVVASAWDLYRGGHREEAVSLVREAKTGLESARRRLTAAQRSDLAELLATLADLRPQVTAWNEAARLYEQAAMLEEEARGTDHAVTLARMLAVADCRRAHGEQPLADAIAALVAAAAPRAQTAASPQQARQLGQSLAGSIRVALAAGDRSAACMLVDPLVAGWANDEALVTAAIDALVFFPDASVTSARRAKDAHTELVSRSAAAATRLAATSPGMAGLGLHATSAAAALRGDRDEQRLELEKAVDTDRRVFGRSHPRVAIHLLALADVTARRAEATAAADLLAEVREIESRGPQAGAEAVPDLRRLAAMHAARGELAAAAALLKGALAAETKGRAGDPLVLAAISADAGAVSAARGMLDRADDLLTEAVTLAQTAFAAGHPDTVAHAVRRDRIKAGLTGPRAMAMAGGAAQAPGEETPGGGAGSSLAKLLRESGRATGVPGRTTVRSGPLSPPRGDGLAAAAPLPNAVIPKADRPLSRESSAQADKARQAFDAALRLYGGDSKKKKKAGPGRQALENIISYTSMIETMANDSAGGLPTAAGSGSRPSTEGRAVPEKASAAPRSLPASRPDAKTPSPFVAASKSGLRQRIALAKRRAVGLPTAAAEVAGITVESLMRAAWSAHFAGSGADAATACDEAVALAARQGGDAGPQLEETLDQAAAIALSQGDYARTRARLERLGSLLWKRLGRNDPRVTEVGLRLAAALAECGEYDRARVLCDRTAASLPGEETKDPTARGQLALVRGRIDLGSGNVAAALRAARQGSALLARAWDRSDRPPESTGRIVRLRLAAAALLEDAGDAVSAQAEIDSLWLSVQGTRGLSSRLVEAIVARGARVRRLTGDAAGANAIAAQGVAMVQRAYKPCPATAVQLAELALSRRSAGDPTWVEPAGSATRILASAARRMTAADNDPDTLAVLYELAAAWLEAGDLRQAADATAAAQLAAGSLPATHPTAGRVVRLAARVAAEKGDVPRAVALLAAAAPRRTGPPPESGREAPFLLAVLPGDRGAAARAAVNRRRPTAAAVSGPAAASPSILRP